MQLLGRFIDRSDDSIKSVFSDNGKIIEMTLLQNRENADVVCAPTHHFCNLGCKMCHLTNNQLNKKMIPIDYQNFEEAIIKAVKDSQGNRVSNKKILLISFMGVGEPLLNLDLLKDVFSHRDLLAQQMDYDHIGFSLSTMMPNDKNLKIIKEFVNINNIPLKIHFSLHTPFDDKRKELIPATTVNIESAMRLLEDYEHTIQSNKNILNEWHYYHKSRDLVEIHYTLIDGNNDSDEELYKLTGIVDLYGFTVKFIRFNPINNMQSSSKEEKWVNTIKSLARTRVKIYTPPGREIGSSCGEFTKHYYHDVLETPEEYQEFIEWEKKHKID